MKEYVKIGAQRLHENRGWYETNGEEGNEPEGPTLRFIYSNHPSVASDVLYTFVMETKEGKFAIVKASVIPTRIRSKLQSLYNLTLSKWEVYLHFIPRSLSENLDYNCVMLRQIPQAVPVVKADTIIGYENIVTGFYAGSPKGN